MTTSAARHSAGHAEEPVAPGAQAVRFVGVLPNYVPCSPLSHAVGEACILVFAFFIKRGKGRRHRGPNETCGYRFQSVQNSAPPTSAGLASSSKSMPHTRQYGRHTFVCATNRLLVRVGGIASFDSLVVIASKYLIKMS